MTTNCRVLPDTVIQIVIRWRNHLPTDTEQRAEGVEWVEPSVKPESELIEICLKMLWTNAVMHALQPTLQVCEDEVTDRQIVFSDLWVTTLDNRKMLVASLG